ncbi:MAG TPA: HAMP domain-containing sensor histidine kinase [Clostridia bacterium]|nr:HAMP domain-containing sensor histidine kinase [Clostridia bacterium]
MISKPYVLENAGCRRLFIFLATASFIFLLILLAATASSRRALETGFISRESAVAGKLLNAHPEMDKTEIVRAFTTDTGAKDYQAGSDALKSAGYSIETADRFFAFAGTGYIGGLLFSFLALAALLLLFFAAMYLSLKNIYQRIDHIAASAHCVTRGEYNTKISDTVEGAFSRLSHSFNEMTGSVAAGFEKLAHERNFLKNLLSDISHQLKTPLSALKMYNEIILQEEISPTVRDFIEKSGGQIERMEWLALGLLKTAQIEAGTLEFDMKPENAAAMAADCVDSFAVTSRESGVSLRSGGISSTVLRCDRRWLCEALSNVIKNCIEHTPPGGTVTVTTDETPVTVSFTVSDTGRGIYPDDLPHIFKRFYTGHGQTGGNSAGIGLSLAKSITEQLGGTLTAKNSLSGGAVFEFTFLKNVI